MAGDCTQLHLRPRPPALAAAGDVGERRDRVDVGQVEPPRDQALERLHRRGRRLRRHEVADQRDADAPRVEPERVRADHVPGDAAVPAFVDLAVPVDEEVVADVVPAVRLHVVDVDAAHDRGRLGRRVAVRCRGVMDDRKPDRRRIERMVPPQQLVAAPGRTRHDRRRAGDRQPPQGLVLDRAPDVIGAQAAHPAPQAVLDAVGGARPDRAAEPPAARRSSLAGAQVRAIVVIGGLPAAPPTGGCTRPEQHGAGPLPVQADQVEANRRLSRGKRSLAAHRQVPRHDRHTAGRRMSLGRRRGDEEREQCDQTDFRHFSRFRSFRMMP